MDLIRRLLAVTLALGTAACAAREGVPRPFPGAALPPGAVEPADRPADAAPPDRADAPAPETPRVAVTFPAPGRPDVVATALGYRGVPYRFGGSDPSGFDCSGFVQYVFRQAGAILPREVRQQFEVGDGIDRDEIAPGDLVFFHTSGRGASHVGVAIGDGQFVHAPSSTGVVRVERLASSYWAPRFVGARRVETRAPDAR